jgi:hypothetical protein
LDYANQVDKEKLDFLAQLESLSGTLNDTKQELQEVAERLVYRHGQGVIE